jgi:hypothetical protein
MKGTGFSAVLAVVVFVAAPYASAQSTGQGRAVITILSKHSEVSPNVVEQDVSAKVNGKDAVVTAWEPFKGADDALELVVMIDAGARNLGPQLNEITSFIQSQGPHAKTAIAIMRNGHAVLVSPFSTNHNEVMSESQFTSGPATNPYFSLSDLAQHWPSQDRNARREVVMLSDGVDPEAQGSNLDDPYVQSAVNDSVHAGLVVYTLYWLNRTERDGSAITVNNGPSLLSELSQSTGGYSYWSGSGNPTSFKPFFDDLERRIANQYALEFTTRLDRKPAVESLKLKVEGLGLLVTAPQQVYVGHSGTE